VDARSRHHFAEAHVPGAVNIELDSMFGTYVGWTIPFGAPLVLLLPEPVGASAERAMTQLIRIGWDSVAGCLAGGIDAWRRQGRPVRGYPTVDVDDLCHAFLEGRDIEVLDVRQPSEWETGHLPGSRNIFVGELPGRVREVRADREIWVACASGHRASIAASFLDRAGANVRLVAQGGVPEWLARCMPRAR
jgi:hydroxyacylglutathione hydrolase